MASHNQNISLRGLRTFCVAAEHESFRDAADLLFITASAVSHQIRNLETELGKKLFERGSRNISLTSDGELLYNDVRPLIRQLDAVAMAHSAQRARSTLRISVQPFFASELFVPKLVEFRKLHPDLDIVVDTSDESAEKHPGNAHASIRVFRSPPSGLAHDELFPLRLIPAGSPEFYDSVKVRAGRIVSKFPIVVHESRPKAWKQWERVSGITLPRDTDVVRLDSMIAVARAAERGLGAALVPTQLSDRWFSSSSLVPLFDSELLTRDCYYFVCDETARHEQNVQILREWVLDSFRDLR
ncbi:MAG TPA: LysR family transcriptional regulator [Woeseiaceae bacterium]|nr:LysR family transcriptional regulator [Woeseiaceae bacterium]